MPTIAQFNGVKVVMRLRNKEHNPPHIHAIYQGFEASFLLDSGELLNGSFPQRQQTMMKLFILLNQKELEEMWETEQYRKLPPLK